jgi:hypothetical protein
LNTILSAKLFKRRSFLLKPVQLGMLDMIYIEISFLDKYAKAEIFRGMKQSTGRGILTN